ncbi:MULTISPECIES: TonB-dependent receptor plug domain-containing protein [Chitinophagaceae]
MKRYPLWLLLLTPASVSAQMSGGSKDSAYSHQLDSITIQTNSQAGDYKKYGDGFSRTENILENIPAVTLISRGNYAQEPVIRSMNDGQILVTVNGMHIFGACTDKMDPSSSYIEPSNLQRISLTTGPAFGIGGSSIGGGLQFQLKEAKANLQEKWTERIATQYETNSQARQLLGQLHYSSLKWAILIDGVYRKANNYTPGGNKSGNITQYGKWSPAQVFTVNDNGQINYSQYQKWNIHANTVYQVSHNGILKLDYIHDDGSNIGYPALSMDVKYARSNIVGLHYIVSNTKGKRSYWESALYYNKINHAMDDTKRPLDQLSMHMDMPGWSDTKGAFSQMNWNLTPHQKLKLKLEAYSNRWHAEMTMYPKNGGASMFMMTIPDAERKMVGADIENQWHLHEEWKFILGAHLEYDNSILFTSQGKKQLSTISSDNPNQNHIPYNAYINIQHALSSYISTDLYVARTMRVPTLREMYAIYLFNPLDNYDYIGNPILKKETSWNMEWRWHFIQKSWNLNTKLYSYFFQNYIAGFINTQMQSMTETAYGIKQFGNIKHAYLTGTEVSFQWAITPHLSYNSNNSYSYGNDENKNALPLVQSFRSNNIVEWHIHKGFQVYAENLTTVRQNHVSNFYGEKATPGFAIFHIGANKTLTFKQQSLNIGLDARNIFNKYYYEHLDVVQLPRQGRNIQIRLSYQF